MGAGYDGSFVPAGASLGESMAWVPLDLPVPEAVEGAGFAALASQGTGVLFGGQTAVGLSNSTALYNESADDWTTLSPVGAPSARSDFGFSADALAQSAVLFGGQVNATTYAVSNETWVYHFATDQWTNVSSVPAPSQRQDPSFAVGNGTALLFGGWDRNVSGTGEVTYSDTWLLNLTTDGWKRVALGSGPAPGALHGASLLWQPSMNAFLLFGGCYPCSAAVWSFSPETGNWSRLAGASHLPPPRMNAVWTWDPAQGVDLMFGGTNGTAQFDDTFLFEPTTTTWTRATTPIAPSARSVAAADFLDSPGNQTLILAGGTNGAAPLSDTWRLAAVSNLTVRVTNASSGLGILNASVQVNHGSTLVTNVTGYVVDYSIPSMETVINASQAGYAAGSRVLWVPPGANVGLVLPLAPLPPGILNVTVAESNGTPVARASVELAYGARIVPGSPRLTSATGIALFADVPSASYSVLVSKTGFHELIQTVDVAPGRTTWANLTLTPLFVLTVVTYGRLADGNLTPIEGVAVVVENVPVGVTGALGTLVTTLNVTGNLSVTASVYGYNNASARVIVKSTGSALVNLTLTARPYPVITLEILGQRGHGPGFNVRGAYVNVTSATPLPSGMFWGNYTTGVEGTVTLSPPAGNYTVRVAAPGFLSNDSLPVIEAAPGDQIGRTVYLQLVGFSTLDVWVLSAAMGNPPIGGAELRLNFTGVNLSDGLPYPSESARSLPTGWANFSGVPQTKALWSASAPGYYPKNGSFTVVYGSLSNEFTVYLTPLPPAKYTGLDIFPGASADAWPLAAIPIACLVGALVYLTMLRNPTSREREMREEARSKLKLPDRPNGP